MKRVHASRLDSAPQRAVSAVRPQIARRDHQARFSIARWLEVHAPAGEPELACQLEGLLDHFEREQPLLADLGHSLQKVAVYVAAPHDAADDVLRAL